MVFKVKKQNYTSYFKDKEHKILHREDGPAFHHKNGHKEWWVNGNLHREDGPAIEYSDGGKEWCKNGKRHREDGPARTFINGTKAYYLNGKCYSEREYWAIIKLGVFI